MIWPLVCYFHYAGGICRSSNSSIWGRNRRKNTPMRERFFTMIKPKLSFDYFDHYGSSYLLSSIYFILGL